MDFYSERIHVISGSPPWQPHKNTAVGPPQPSVLDSYWFHFPLFVIFWT